MIWALLGAGVVGVSLGLLGSGGAILTVPILVYLVGHNEKTAIAESLAIVGVIALAGAIRAATQRRVDFRSAMLLALPGIVGTFVGAMLARWVPGAVQLLLLALLMLTAAVLMFRSGRRPLTDLDASIAPERRPPDSGRTMGIILAQGFGLGLATGLVGVGGGFLIVPVLVLLRRLSMPIAVGTSLAIIAVNSAVGFVKYITLLRGHGVEVDWGVIGMFAALGVAGSLVGNALSGRIPKQTLKQVFAVFLIVMAAYIVYRQAPRVLAEARGQHSAEAVR